MYIRRPSLHSPAISSVVMNVPAEKLYTSPTKHTENFMSLYLHPFRPLIALNIHNIFWVWVC